MITPAYESFVNEICIDYKEANEGIVGELIKSFVLKFIVAPFLVITVITIAEVVCIASYENSWKKEHKKDFENAKAYTDFITKKYQDAVNSALKDSKIKNNINSVVKNFINKQLKENKDLVSKYNLSIKDFNTEIKKCPVNIKMPEFRDADGRISHYGFNTAQVPDACLICVSSLKKETITRFDETDAYFADRFTGMVFYDPVKNEIIKDIGYDKKLPENVIDKKEYDNYINSIKK